MTQSSNNEVPPSIVIGNFKVMYRPDGLYQTTKARLVQQGLQLEETMHFLVARPVDTDRVMVIHRFLPTEIDNNLVDYLMQELPAFMTSDQAFGHAMIGVVQSMNPRDPAGAWGMFCLNTLQRLRDYLNDDTFPYPPTTIGASATVYRRLFSLKVGRSLLDVGCACAFWPTLVAERTPNAHGRIVGVDNRLDAVHLSQNMATLTQQHDLTFLQVDVLSSQFVEALGSFDTVTAIHLLEHLPEEQLSLALEQLLHVTRHRLMAAVPYEAEPTRAYGHAQVFTREKLERWGKWCIESMGGTGRYWCEEVAGGLLVVDRF